jgi:hypothetical protein
VSSSFGTATYIAQKGGASTSAGVVITPATAVPPLRLNVAYGWGDASNGCDVQPTTVL